MHSLTSEQLASLAGWLGPERPGPVIAGHIINTGHGSAFVDRWPNPSAIITEAGGNYMIQGDPGALSIEDLREHVKGFIAAPTAFEPVLRSAFPDMQVWPRVVFHLPEEPSPLSVPGYELRRLTEADLPALEKLSAENQWIAKTWGGMAGMAASGRAWGAFADGRIASIACPFFVGQRYEDIGVVTEPQDRGKGLSPACAGAVCRDIVSYGRTPSWTTSPDNIASLRVAQKLGFIQDREDVLYVAGIPIPPPARRDTEEQPSR